MKEHFNSWVPKLIGAGAITLPPFGIFYKHDKADYQKEAYGYAYVRRHEVTHVAQWLRMGTFKFYLTYLWQALTHGFRHDSIPMEIEANSHETDPNYWAVPESVLPRALI